MGAVNAIVGSSVVSRTIGTVGGVQSGPWTVGAPHGTDIAISWATIFSKVTGFELARIGGRRSVVDGTDGRVVASLAVGGVQSGRITGAAPHGTVIAISWATILISGTRFELARIGGRRSVVDGTDGHVVASLAVGGVQSGRITGAAPHGTVIAITSWATIFSNRVTGFELAISGVVGSVVDGGTDGHVVASLAVGGVQSGRITGAAPHGTVIAISWATILISGTGFELARIGGRRSVVDGTDGHVVASLAVGGVQSGRITGAAPHGTVIAITSWATIFSNRVTGFELAISGVVGSVVDGGTDGHVVASLAVGGVQSGRITGAAPHGTVIAISWATILISGTGFERARIGGRRSVVDGTGGLVVAILALGGAQSQRSTVEAPRFAVCACVTTARIGKLSSKRRTQKTYCLSWLYSVALRLITPTVEGWVLIIINSCWVVARRAGFWARAWSYYCGINSGDKESYHYQAKQECFIHM